MVTVTIKEQSKQARAVVEMLKTFPFVEFKESSKKITSTQKPRYNTATEKAIKDARKGKTTKTTLAELREIMYS